MLGICWVVHLPSNSDHQDCFMFRIVDPNLNLHLPLESWEGGQLFFRGVGNVFFLPGSLGPMAESPVHKRKRSPIFSVKPCHLWGPDFLGLASKND